jgi:hypothetical protein
MKDLNTILAIIITLTASAGVFVWCEPTAAVWVSDRLYARAQAQRAGRAAYRAAWSAALVERGAA